MGAIQNAVNQALGTGGTLAGLGKLVKSQEKSVDIQEEAMKKAERRFAEEQKVKELKLQKMKETGQALLKTTDKKNWSDLDSRPVREKMYLAEHLEKQYLELGDIQKAAQFREAQTKYSDLIKRQEQANVKVEQLRLAKQAQQKRMEEFRLKFTEGGRYN